MSGRDSTLPGVIAPPPLLYLGTFAAAAVAQALRPWPLLAAGSVAAAVGLVVLLLSAAFARWAFVTMRRTGTSAALRRPSVALVTGGPFALSRNPIYVAMTGLYLGAGALLNSGWPLLCIVPLMLVMHWGVVRREERYLRAQFGGAYAAYAATVRRWL